MHDLRAIRENAEGYDANWARRGLEAQSSSILALDEKRRSVQTELQAVQGERNVKSKEIGKIKSQGGDADGIMAEVSALKDKMAELEIQEAVIAEELNDYLVSLPNMMADDVPAGADDTDNVEIRKWGTPRADSDAVPEHFEIGEKLGMMDAEVAAKMSGSRFTVMKAGLARLERALGQFFLDTHTDQHGYVEVIAPLLVRDNAVFGTGQLPKFSEDLFQTTTGHWLVPTSEVTLTNLVADSIVDEDTLPLRYTALTPCFRSEAGSAGRDTRGYLRQHQFHKVEMVGIVHPDESEAEQKRMVECAQTVLEKLDLPYRTVELCTGDTGFCARRTFDLEVWMPGQDCYREISSVSTCGDFQARRMKARFRKKGEKETRFLHTLNGSGVAVGRALIAVMENYYDPADGGIFVPDALKPYMGGLEKVTKD